MRVWISYSGTLGQVVAPILTAAIRALVPTAEVRSPAEGIVSGQQLQTNLRTEAANSQIAFILLSKATLHSPWTAYEGGVLSSLLGERSLVPFLLDLTPSELTGPFAFYQAVVLERESLRQLGRHILELAGQPERRPSELGLWADELLRGVSVHIPAVAQASDSSERSLLSRIRAAAESRDLDELRSVKTSLLSQASGVSNNVWQELAQAHLRLRDFEGHLALYHSLPEGIQKDPSLLGGFATALIRAGRLDEGIDVINRATREEPSNAELWALLGSAYKRQWQAKARDAAAHNGRNFLESAAAAYSRAFELGRHPYAGLNAASSLFILGIPPNEYRPLLEATAESIQASLQNNPTDYWMLASLLEIALIVDDEALASEAAVRLADTAPDTWQLESTFAQLELLNRFSIPNRQWLPKVTDVLKHSQAR